MTSTIHLLYWLSVCAVKTTVRRGETGMTGGPSGVELTGEHALLKRVVLGCGFLHKTGSSPLPRPRLSCCPLILFILRPLHTLTHSHIIMVLAPDRHVTRWWSNQPPVLGYWGPSTSSIDWCEANYAITRFIAEFTNTLSNLVFVSWAV